MDGYEVDDDKQPAPKNKPSARGNTDRSIYKEVLVWNGIDHRREVGYRQDSVKLDGMNEKFISVLTYLT